MKILIADDEKDILDLLEIYLSNEGFESVKACDGEMALDYLLNDPSIDLAVLDIMMPKMTGIEIVEELRKRDLSIPIIIASAKTEDKDKIKGLLAGADDYVTKPFNPLEVIARIKSLLRRQYNYATAEVPSDTIEIGPLLIRKDSHEVKTTDGQEIQLTLLEFGILYLLASNPGQVFSADEIFESVWNQESVVSNKTVMVHVSHLRDKIEAATGGNKVIQTVWGVGYKVER